MEVWAYVFITTREPRRVLRAVRLITGVIHADALFGSPDVVAIVSGSNVGELDGVIDRVAEVPKVERTDSKIARWIDGVGPPRAAPAVV
jgi:DNA helicase HerA-like ATPase